jgi:hypothetical protein
MLFDSVFIHKPKDNFPYSEEYKDEINNWLIFLQNKEQLHRFKSRLDNSQRTVRDETLSEISSAYLMEMNFKYKVIDWERKTINCRDVDFIIQDGSDEIYCEAKSPGWESDLTQSERLNGRKELPKYENGEFRYVDPRKKIRYAIKKAYPKFLPDCKNLLILKPDLFESFLHFPLTLDIALFDNKSTYGNEKGYFVDSDYANIGGILILEFAFTSKPNNDYIFAKNKNAKTPFSINNPEIQQFIPSK